MRQEWRLDATIRNLANDSFYQHGNLFENCHCWWRREEERSVGDITDGESLCAVTQAPLPRAHCDLNTVSSEKIAFSRLPSSLQAPWWNVATHMTAVSSCLSVVCQWISWQIPSQALALSYTTSLSLLLFFFLRIPGSLHGRTIRPMIFFFLTTSKLFAARVWPGPPSFIESNSSTQCSQNSMRTNFLTLILFSWAGHLMKQTKHITLQLTAPVRRQNWTNIQIMT